MSVDTCAVWAGDEWRFGVCSCLCVVIMAVKYLYMCSKNGVVYVYQ